MRLKLRRNTKAATEPDPHEGWPVVDGSRVKPYELPPDRPGNQKVLRQIERDHRRRAESERTMFNRGLGRIVNAMRERKGPGYVWYIWPRYTVEVHRRPTGGGRAWSFEVYRRGLQHVEWHFTVDLWRSS